MYINIRPDFETDRPGFQKRLRGEIWPELLGNGKLSGDERWIIGENLNQELIVYLFCK
jgi:hypothetical protein